MKVKIGTALLGMLFWFCTTFFINYFGEYYFSNGGQRILLLYCLSIPFCWCFVYIIKNILNTVNEDILPDIVAFSFEILILDSILLIVAKGIYNMPYSELVPAAGWKIWCVGTILFLVMLINKNKSATSSNKDDGKTASKTRLGRVQKF